MNTMSRRPRPGGSGGEPCPFCADQHGPLLLRGPGALPACPVCGRVPRVVRLVRLSNYFEQRRRRALERGEEE
jgi:hypothetical protein